jgi:antitoxin FitA
LGRDARIRPRIGGRLRQGNQGDIIAGTRGGADVASIVIRQLDEDLKGRLRVQAARHGRSMEEEARTILRNALSSETGSGQDLLDAIRDLFGPLGGVELELPPRGPMRDPPRFDE